MANSDNQLRVSDNQRYLVRADGSPFFWLADTAWELFHRLNLEDAALYLRDRASKGFNVIQAVGVAQLDGLLDPNANGHLPLENSDPTKPLEPYWQHVDNVLKLAEDLGMYIALLPTWGDKFNARWGIGPAIFNPENARVYGRWLGKRFARRNVIWVLGGDRPLDNELQLEVIREMAAGVREGDGGYGLISYHPTDENDTVEQLWSEPWHDFAMLQSGHKVFLLENYKTVHRFYTAEPPKPVVDSEPCYEAHPLMSPEFKPLGDDRFRDFHVRRAAWWAVLSGAMGHTYGTHGTWQMYTPEREPVNRPEAPWYDEIHLPGSLQMQHLKNLMLKRPFHQMVPHQELVKAQPSDGLKRVASAMHQDGLFAIFYLPGNETVEVDLAALRPGRYQATWLNPITAETKPAGTFSSDLPPTFSRPESWRDAALVLDHADADLPVL